MDTEVIEFIKNNDFNNFIKFIEDNKNDQYFYNKIKKIIQTTIMNNNIELLKKVLLAFTFYLDDIELLKFLIDQQIINNAIEINNIDILNEILNIPNLNLLINIKTIELALLTNNFKIVDIILSNIRSIDKLNSNIIEIAIQSQNLLIINKLLCINNIDLDYIFNNIDFMYLINIEELLINSLTNNDRQIILITKDNNFIIWYNKFLETFKKYNYEFNEKLLSIQNYVFNKSIILPIKNNENFKNKYLKYKKKYLELKIIKVE
jgi:hypothetical protein